MLECGCVCFDCGLVSLNYLIMEMFSLEDDGNELFITQESARSDILNNSVGLSGQSLAQSMETSVFKSHYSDISEDDFEIPSSQKHSYSAIEFGR